MPERIDPPYPTRPPVGAPAGRTAGCRAEPPPSGPAGGRYHGGLAGVRYLLAVAVLAALTWIPVLILTVAGKWSLLP